MTSVAAAERALLADLLDQVGPDAPTLCDPWSTRDLAAHLVLRERRPLAALGIRLPPVAAYTRRVQDDVARTPWPELVDTLRHRSPLLLGPAEEWVNTAEFFVHHEDVRRAVDGWAPRPQDPRTEATMWRVLRRAGRALFRHSPVPVRLVLPDGREHTVMDGVGVTLKGPATELLLFAFGRRAHARVQVTGEPAAVAAFRGTPLEV